MHLTLKPLATLSEEEIGLVTLPFFAVSYLKGSQRGCGTLSGYATALAACMDRHDRYCDHKQRAFERLCQQVEEAVLVVLEKQPLSAAYYQVDGQWQVTKCVWGVFARTRLEQQLKHIEQQKHQQAFRQTQRVTASAFIIEEISEAERRTITLGPHEEPGYQSWSNEQPAVYTGPPDEGIEPIFSPMDVVDAMLEGTAVAGIRDYLPSRRNVVKQMKVDIEPGRAASDGVAPKSAKPSLSAHKEALKKAQQEVGKLPKGKPGKFGSPQAGDSRKGYRLDPPHDGVATGEPESKPHINWWDYSSGKRGKGGRSGAIPIED